MKIVLRAEVRARMGLAIALVISAGAGVWAGFNNGKDTDARNYRGSALTDDEKKAVECAIKEIKAMAGNDHSEKNRETLKRIADCLADMLKDGKICSESGTNDAKAATLPESPRKCTWTGDKINVRPKCLKKTEPDFSKLIAVLVHEGIHCLQWQTPTSDGRETVAYAWEAYILCRRLAEATLTDAQKEDIGKRKAFTKWQSDVRGDDSLTEEEKKKKHGCQPALPDRVPRRAATRPSRCDSDPRRVHRLLVRARGDTVPPASHESVALDGVSVSERA